ncbi:MAG: SpaH/EbpB family LPXTG-anchored major pilin [Clostridia bacterium]|nr:SpaH/EbpB family LPXTG-anchored major pilin [Clostridia bacterium]
MTKTFRKVIAVILTVAMVLSMFSITSFADGTELEYVNTNAYTLAFSQTIEGYEEYSSKQLSYALPHAMQYDLLDPSTGTMTTRLSETNVFHLVDTVKVAAGPAAGEEGTPYASLWAYCTDNSVPVDQAGANYRRVNLEDSTYYDDVASGRIRAVVMNAVPVMEAADLQSAVNAWLEANKGAGNYTALTDLTASEAALATQAAIWQIANSDAFNATDPYGATSDMTAYEAAIRSMVVWEEPISPWDTASDNTKANVKAVFDYLCSLDPVDASANVVSDSTINITSATTAEGVTTVNFTTDATVGADDELVATVFVGEEKVSLALTAENVDDTHTVAVSGEGDVRVEINGYQTAEDVFLYDAEGDRTTSQTLVGYSNSSMPVHAEATTAPERVLNIWKYTPATVQNPGDGTEQEVADTYTPLANVQFAIFKVCTIDEYLDGTVDLNTIPSEEEIATYAVIPNQIATITTDENGFATHSFGYGEEDGIYLIVELPNAAVTAPIDPFFVSIPMSNEDNTDTLYTVNVYPKNDTAFEEPVIDKDVTEITNKSDTFDVNDAHTWIIQTSIPNDIVDALKYSVTDTLDTRLTYVEDSVVVKLAQLTDAANAETVTLEKNTDYTLTVTTVDGVTTITVDLTEKGMDAIAAAVGDDYANYEVRVYIDTVINETADLGVIIPNSATINYENAIGFDFSVEVKEEDKPEVHTGGLQISKVNDDGEVLADATFKIVRAATEAEIADESIEKIEIGGVSYVYVDFYATSDMSGEKVYEVTTDENGNAIIFGLAYGDYKIIETVAPTGYNLLRDPVDVAIGETSHLDENSVEVVNINKFTLPSTGGIGTTIFTVTGLILIGAAVVLIVISKKKRRTAA